MEKSIEKLKRKLKSSALITLILGLISITWLIVDYFVVQTIITEGSLSKFSLEWILILISGLAFICFHISVFVTLFYAFRIVGKIKIDKSEEEENDSTESRDL